MCNGLDQLFGLRLSFHIIPALLSPILCDRPISLKCFVGTTEAITIDFQSGILNKLLEIVYPAVIQKVLGCEDHT